MLNQVSHATAALRALTAAAEDLARRYDAKRIDLHQAADGLLDVARGNDIALADNHS
jgi:hypothetical protein